MRVVVLLLALMPVWVSAANALKGHESPYLRLHADDPVAWQELTPQTLDRAQRENKPILISSGYFSCHWCHVMQQESFQNEAMAREINDLFIPVKMDRELDPVTDAYLNRFVENIIGTSGWPLTVMVTPEGYALAGTTYLPSAEFRAWYKRFDRAWSKNSRQLSLAAKQVAQSETAAYLVKKDKAQVDQLAGDLLEQSLLLFDELQGGFGQQAKFPSSPQLIALMRLYSIAPQKELRPQLILTMNQMMRLGLRDYVQGGFFRYTTDPDWRTPHFEKMLYDNAQLALVYITAADLFDNGGYYGVSLHTVQFLRESMQSKQGAYYAALSAVDAEGREGAAYLWSEQELKSLVEKRYWPLLQEAWGLENSPTFEYGYLPIENKDYRVLAKQFSLSETKTTQVIADAWAKLNKKSVQRIIPVDEKQLTGWNGLALSALSHVAQYGDKDAKKSADRLAKLLLRAIDEQGKLSLSFDKRSTSANLNDYAYVARGLLDWQKYAKGKPDTSLNRMLEYAWKRYYRSSGWLLGNTVLPAAQQRVLHQADDALPSPTGVMFDVAVDLMDQSEWKKRADGLARSVTSDLSENAFFHATTIMALAKYERKVRGLE